MKQEGLYKVFIWGFLFLYLLVAGISFIHAIEFFSIGNPTIMASVLAFAFELGLALSLAAILLSDENKKQKLPWILMIILTFVQVVGNVYSTFKHISMSDVDYYVYLQKPLLFWIEEVSQDTVQVIISWIIGAILPIVALFMTDMVASNIKNVEASKKKKLENSDIDIEDEQIQNDVGTSLDVNNDSKETTISKDPDINEHIDEQHNEVIEENNNESQEINEEITDTSTDINIEKIHIDDAPIKTSISSNTDNFGAPIKNIPYVKTNIPTTDTDINSYEYGK